MAPRHANGVRTGAAPMSAAAVSHLAQQACGNVSVLQQDLQAVMGELVFFPSRTEVKQETARNPQAGSAD